MSVTTEPILSALRGADPAEELGGDDRMDNRVVIRHARLVTLRRLAPAGAARRPVAVEALASAGTRGEPVTNLSSSDREASEKARMHWCSCHGLLRDSAAMKVASYGGRSAVDRSSKGRVTAVVRVCKANWRSAPASAASDLVFIVEAERVSPSVP